MTNKIIISTVGLKKIHPPKKEVIKNLSLSFFYGAKIGVIGKNGTGKSSLLKIIAGIDREYQGELVIDKQIKIGYLSQEPKLDRNLNVIENIKLGMKEPLALLSRFEELSAKMGEDLSDDEMEKVSDEFSRVQEKIDASDGWSIERTLDIAMDALMVPPGEANVESLSGGEVRRVALCQLLLSNPDVLLLDEPTNHLDAESVEWLETYLKGFKGTLITVTHDRYFLDNISNWILEMDKGEGYPYEGNYSAWLASKRARLATEEKEESKRQKTLKRELDWIRKGAKGRHTKSKARISAYENLLSQEHNKDLDKLEINIPLPPRLGEKVIEITSLNKCFGDRMLIKDLNMSIPRGSIMGIIGPNGMGKTTLFKMIAGLDVDYEGELSKGDTVKLAYVDQFRDDLNDDNNIWEVISDGQEEIDLGYRKMHSRAYVGSFGFKGIDQQKKVGGLSGGERNRVHLAKLLKAGGNVLLLDEPTNDLDIDTLRSLEEALLSFAGCILAISHDRYFLDRISTHILSFEGEGEIVLYQGNYSEYEAHKKELAEEKVDGDPNDIANQEKKKSKFRKLQP